MRGGRSGNKKVGWAIFLACIATTTGIVVYAVAISGRNPLTPTKPSTVKESLQATYEGYSNNIFTVDLADNGTNSVLVTDGSCSSGYCALVNSIAVNAGQSNVTMTFSGSPPSGPTVFNVTTSKGNTFQWTTSSPAFNPHLGKETLVFDGYGGYVIYPNSLYVYSLNVTNTGSNDVAIEGGSCTAGSCTAYPVVLKPNVETTMAWGSRNPCPGYIAFTAVTALGNTFTSYMKAC